VMSCENEDKRWVPDNAGNRLCAQVARAVYDHFDEQHARAAREKKPEAAHP
jgi:beta-lactamase class A